MPWCITCGEIEAAEKLRKAGIIKRKKALDFPDHMFEVVSWTHKRISFIQYLKCKFSGHDCYL